MLPGTGDPEGMALGPDGGLWFAGFLGDTIGRASTTSTALVQFNVGIAAPNSGLRFIARGPDGNMWFTEEMSDKIGRVTVDPPVAVTPPPPPPADTTPPVVSKVSLSPSRFLISATTTAKIATASGTTISYTLSEAASAALKIEKVSTGRRVGGSCVLATHANRKAKSCLRYTSFGTLKRTGAAGANTVAFSGRVGSTALLHGSYRVSVTATDAAKNVSKSATAFFTVLSPPKPKHKHATARAGAAAAAGPVRARETPPSRHAA